MTDNPNYKITFMLDSAAMITVHTPKRGVVEVGTHTAGHKWKYCPVSLLQLHMLLMETNLSLIVPFNCGFRQNHRICSEDKTKKGENHFLLFT